MSSISMGNPHAVIFVEDVDARRSSAGPALEQHPAFPNRVNVEFVQILVPRPHPAAHLGARHRRDARLRERRLRGRRRIHAARRVERAVAVELRGGELQIDWADKTARVLMTGPAATVFTGEGRSTKSRRRRTTRRGPMFEGVFTALVTPFRDGQVDEGALREHVELQIAAGVDGVVPCGSTGEAATLSHAEHRRVVEIVVEAARGRVAVLAGTGSNTTREAIELTRHAKEAGADGALLISPYYNKPTQEGIVAHYAAIAEATRFPLVALQHPGPHGVEHRARDHRAARRDRAHRRREGGVRAISTRSPT